MTPRILVVQHEPECPPALIGEWLVESGCDLDVCRAWAEPLPPLKGYAGLMVLGGAGSASGEDERYPWFVPTRARIAEAAEHGVPTLAICLGHQLAAVALGGEVGRNPYGRTVGLRQVDWEPCVLFDPLVGAIAGDDRAMHGNWDVVTQMPEGGEVLATTLDGAVQAARFAPTVWGVQFHPEVDVEIVRGWTHGEPAFDGVDATAAEILNALDHAMPELIKTWQPLGAAFAALVRGRAAVTELTEL